MLFTLVVNLLLSCLMLLLGGWTCDALSKWKGAGMRAIAETSLRVAASRLSSERIYESALPTLGMAISCWDRTY